MSSPAVSLVALQHRNFRLLWLGQLVSHSGSMMQTAAVLWHVALLADPGTKGLALGLVGLARLVPIVLLAPVSGVVADARDRRRLMLVTQTGMAGVAVILGLLTITGLASVSLLYLLSALGSATASFDNPARQSLIPTLVPRQHLPNAISLNTIMVQVASVGGPSLAGIVIATQGVAAVYWLNAVSFLAVIAALLRMRDVPFRSPTERSRVSVQASLEGMRFVWTSPLIRSTVLLDFLATFFGSATALLPIFAQDVFRVGPRGYGWLYAAPSLGALLASAAMVRLVDRVEGRGRLLLGAVAGYGLATVGFGLAPGFGSGFLCLAATGAADTVSMVLRNVLRQLETPDHLRGRVVGLTSAFFMGGPQLGELEAGLVAQWLGAPASVVIGGLGCLAATAWVAAATPGLRRYRR